jgi:aconitate hydratase
VLTDLTREPLGIGADGKPVMLADIWPSDAEVAGLLSQVTPGSFRKAYHDAPLGHASWATIAAADGAQFPWAASSTFITPSPLDIAPAVDGGDTIDGMRALAIFGDGITTDTLSPNGEILAGTPAAAFLAERGVKPASFGNYAARRGSHEIAVRGMFANPHVENEMLAGKRGPHTLLMPDQQETTIFAAGMAYVARGTPAIVIAGKAYGSGSSRDWAAKGLRHLGVRVVLAESFERIHRANLVGVGILPVTFAAGTSRKTLGLTGREMYRLRGLRDGLKRGGRLTLDVIRQNGETASAEVDLNLETDNDIRVLRAGGLLPVLLREFAAAG